MHIPMHLQLYVANKQCAYAAPPCSSVAKDGASSGMDIWNTDRGAAGEHCSCIRGTCLVVCCGHYARQQCCQNCCCRYCFGDICQYCRADESGHALSQLTELLLPTAEHSANTQYMILFSQCCMDLLSAATKSVAVDHKYMCISWPCMLSKVAAGLLCNSSTEHRSNII